MKISNFRDYTKIPGFGHSKTTQRLTAVEYAIVDVETTKFFFFKRKEVRAIYRRAGGIFWKFSNTDKYTPDDVVENLHNEYNGNTRIV